MAKMQNDALGKIQITIKLFMRRHKFLLTSALAAIILMSIATALNTGANKPLADKKKELADVENEITQVNIQTQKVVEVVDDPDHGLSNKRWSRDDAAFVEWIDPAITWTGDEGYRTARNYFVERLGATDPFVVEFLSEPEEKTTGTMIGYEISTLPADIAMWGGNFMSYVYAVDDLTGTYSYVATMEISSQDGSLQIGTNRPKVLGRTLIFMYDVTEAGEIQNFRHSLVI